MLLNRNISIGYFINTIKYDIIAISLYAVVIGFMDNYSVLSSISIPLGLTSVVGTSVALLLAFRTSQSYERWWEARIIWGAIVNDSRTLVRQVQSFYTGDDAKDIVKEFAYRQIYWCQALTHALRKTEFSEECKMYMEKTLIKDGNIPNVLLSKHSDQLRKALQEKKINEFQQIQIDTTIVNLCNSMGRCERIKNTVFPKSYSTLIHFLIYFFVTILPFGLSDDFISLEIFLCISVPMIFIAIEKTSILMQDPFENLPLDTPMTTISRTIEINIKQMIGDESIPETPLTNSYFIL